MSKATLRESLVGVALAAIVGVSGAAGIASAQATNPQRDMQERTQPQAQPRATQDRPSRVIVSRTVEDSGTNLGWLGLLGLAGLLGLRGRDRHAGHMDPSRRTFEEHTRRPDDPTTRGPII